MTDELQRRAFDRRAAGYGRLLQRERWPRNQEWKARQIAAALAGVSSDDLLVELGCGTGQVAELVLRQLPCRYLGVDVSAEMLARARQALEPVGSRVELRQEPAHRLTLEDGAAAAAYGVDVLHHVADRPATLAELRRVLGRDGRACFLEGNPWYPLNALLAVRREERGLLRSTRRGYLRDFAAAGFDVTVEPTPLFTPPGPPFAVPLWDALDRLLGRLPGVRRLGIFHLIVARRR